MLSNLGLILAPLVSAFVSRKLYQDVFTPLNSYISSWCICLFLFRLRLIDWYELQPKTCVLITLSIAAFTTGCLFAGRRNTRAFRTLTADPSKLKVAIQILLVINLTGVILYLARMHSLYGLSVYLTDPSEIRRDYENWPRIGPLALLVTANYPLFSSSLIHLLTTRKLRWFTFCGILLPCLQSYLQTDRITMGILFATAAFIWIYVNGWERLNRKVIVRISALFCAVVVYFIVGGLLYGKLIARDDETYKNNLNVSSDAAILLINPYIYATAPFPTLQEAMTEVHGHMWGARTFFPLARLFYALGLLRERPEGASLEFYWVPIPANVYTHLFAYYEDFGIPGMLLIPFLLGWAQTSLYLRMKARPSIFLVASAASFMVIDVLSVFITLIATILVWYYLLAMYWVSRRASSYPDLSQI